MKKLYCYAIICMAALFQNKISAQSANTALSNLAATTKINSTLLPNNPNKKDLGSASKAWKNLYVGTGFYFNNNRFMHALGGSTDYPNSNTYIGVAAGDINSSPTAGGFNTGIGYFAMLNNSTGNYNVAVGGYSLFRNSSGIQNIAIGHNALYNNTYGSDNAAIGEGAMYSNVSGVNNVAMGYVALGNNSSGSYNAAFGANALRYSNGSENTAVGNGALFVNSTGSYNTALGDVALSQNGAGSYNTGIGYNTLVNTKSSSFNTALGFDAGSLIDNASYNTFLGTYADVYGGPYINSTAVGYDAQVSASNQIRLGNHSITSIGGFANWSNVSDIRVKKNIKQNVPGLAFINKLQPITYNLDLDAVDKIILPKTKKDKEGKLLPVSQEELLARKLKEKVIYTGFSAQDVEKAAKSLNYDFSGVDAAKSDKDLYGLRYSDFVVPLVKAVQELSHENDSLQKQNDAFEKRIEKLEALLDVNQSTVSGQQSTVVSAASLQQNIPNPFSNSTAINYVLPKTFSSAKIIVTDNAGKTIKEISVSGTGSVQIDASTLSSGAYQYSLIVDGRMIGSKQMILSK